MKILFLLLVGSALAKAGTKIENIRLDTPSPGAKVELLWIVDATSISQPLYFELHDHLSTFYSQLQKSKVSASSILLAADPYWFKGVPIEDKDGAAVLTVDHLDWVENFQERMKSAYGIGGNSSSLWSLLLCLDKNLVSNSPVSGFFEKGVPVEALAFSEDHDWISYYGKGSPYEGLTGAEIGNSLLTKFQKYGKKFRMHAVQPKYPSPNRLKAPRSTDWDTVLPEAAQATGGIFYDYGSRFQMDDVLGNFATESVLKANVFAKVHIPLKEPPSDFSKISLRLRETELSSGTQWEYQARDNSVLLNWGKIDIEVRPGDRLIISYPF